MQVLAPWEAGAVSNARAHLQGGACSSAAESRLTQGPSSLHGNQFP